MSQSGVPVCAVYYPCCEDKICLGNHIVGGGGGARSQLFSGIGASCSNVGQ